MMTQITFCDGLEMFNKIKECGLDLYNTELEIYAFCYNECGSIATYNIDRENALKLKIKANATGEYWSAFLGCGGKIYDSLDYKLQLELKDTCDEAVEFCNCYYDEGSWMVVN